MTITLLCKKNINNNKVMEHYLDLLHRVLAATDDGRRIIDDWLPALIVKGNIGKAFSLRDDDHSPSAHLVPPSDKYKSPGWHVKDFGMHNGWYSAVDVYMMSRGYDKSSQYMFALHELAERYGVSDKLDPRVNTRRVTFRDATAEELRQPPHIEYYDNFDDINLARVFIPSVKPEHLTTYGWRPVKQITRVSAEGKLIVLTADPATYPVFAQECHHTDEQGNVRLSHHKIYEPFSPKKEYRFWTIGEVPADYMYGRDALLRRWRKGGEQQLPVVLVVSGGSDALCALSYGYPAIWFNSETRTLKPDELAWLQKYCQRVVYVADIDPTGTSVGKTLSLSMPTLCVAWIDPKELGGLHDARGRELKDLKDYLTLHPRQEDMDRLVGGARCAQIWREVKKGDKGDVSYTVSEVSLTYFLWLNGYCQLKDDDEAKPQYIHIDKGIVRRVKAKSIHSFLKEWGERQGIAEGLLNQLLKSCRNMITDTAGNLKTVDTLDFTTATATSQLMYFSNYKVSITAKGIGYKPYSTIDDGCYVWQDAVIQHTFRPMKPMFSWQKGDDGRYHITIEPKAPSKMLRVVQNMARIHWRKETEMHLELSEPEKGEQEQCLVVLLLAIGYLLHRYKSASAAWAPLLMDYAIGNSSKERNGRSGKTFILKAVGTLLRMAYIDMMTWTKKGNQQFTFAGVKDSTGLIVIDECPEDFAFSFLNAKITDDLEVECKGKDAFVIPFSKSPKIGIATNHHLDKHDPSTEGRFAPVVVSDYYHWKTPTNDYLESRKIYNEFNQNLLRDDYAESDFQADAYFMLECLQMYLSLPVDDRRQTPPMARIERRELQTAIGDTFMQWANENLAPGSEWLDRKVKADDLLAAFNQDTRYGWSPKKFSQRLKQWCSFAEHIVCYNPASVTCQKNDGERWQGRDKGIRTSFYYLQSKAAEKLPMPTEGDLPF